MKKSHFAGREMCFPPKNRQKMRFGVENVPKVEKISVLGACSCEGVLDGLQNVIRDCK